MAKGTLVKVEPNGTLSHVRVERKEGWTVGELYILIGNGCDIVVEGLRVVYDQKPRIAYVDENARIAIRGRPIPPVNEKATQMYRAYYGPDAKEILGVAVVWIPDRVEGVGRRGVLSTKRKRAEKAKETEAETLQTPEADDLTLTRDTIDLRLSGDRMEGHIPPAPLSDEI